MILAIDIGNTNIVVGCFEDNKILFSERVSTNHTATDMEYATTIRTVLHIHDLDSSMLTGAIISSVVPGVTSTVKKAIEKYTKLADAVGKAEAGDAQAMADLARGLMELAGSLEQGLRFCRASKTCNFCIIYKFHT